MWDVRTQYNVVKWCRWCWNAMSFKFYRKRRSTVVLGFYGRSYILWLTGKLGTKVMDFVACMHALGCCSMQLNLTLPTATTIHQMFFENEYKHWRESLNPKHLDKARLCVCFHSSGINKTFWMLSLMINGIQSCPCKNLLFWYAHTVHTKLYVNRQNVFWRY